MNSKQPSQRGVDNVCLNKKTKTATCVAGLVGKKKTTVDKHHDLRKDFSFYELPTPSASYHKLHTTAPLLCRGRAVPQPNEKPHLFLTLLFSEPSTAMCSRKPSIILSTPEKSPDITFHFHGLQPSARTFHVHQASNTSTIWSHVTSGNSRRNQVESPE